MFHRAFFNSIIDKHQHMHFFTFDSILVCNVNFNVKIHKKYLKVLRHVSILTDHHQGVGLYLVKVTELFKKLKNTEFKILTINPGVVAGIYVAGVRGDPCGAVRCTAPQGSPRTSATYIPATTPGLIVRILNSMFFNFLNNSVTLTRYRPTP